MKIVKIEGFRGIITALFIGACLFAGFVLFPGYVSMYLWNKYFVELLSFPVINHIQGVLLWGILAVSYCILSKGGFAVSFKTAPHELSDNDINMIMRNAKIYSKIRNINEIMQSKDEFVKSNPYDSELKENNEEKISSISQINNDDNDEAMSN